MEFEATVESFWKAAASGEALPQDVFGTLDFDASLRVQLAVLDRRLAGGARLAGWKIGLTSARVRERLGTELQPFGYILESGVHASGERIALEGFRAQAGIEPELMLTLGSDLHGPGVTPEAARAAVESVSAGMELNEHRVPASDFGVLVADDLAQWGIVQGDTSPLPADFDSDSLRVTLTEGGTVRSESLGAEVIDDHFLSLATLANTLARFDRHVSAGERVITGSFSNHRVSEPGRWRAEFSGLGAVEIEFV